MSKMRYFSNKLSKSPSAGCSPPQAPLNLRFGYLKLRGLHKLCFFKLIMMKSNLKNRLWRHFSDWRHRY